MCVWGGGDWVCVCVGACGDWVCVCVCVGGDWVGRWVCVGGDWVGGSMDALYSAEYQCWQVKRGMQVTSVSK